MILRAVLSTRDNEDVVGIEHESFGPVDTANR